MQVEVCFCVLISSYLLCSANDEDLIEDIDHGETKNENCTTDTHVNATVVSVIDESHGTIVPGDLTAYCSHEVTLHCVHFALFPIGLNYNCIGWFSRSSWCHFEFEVGLTTLFVNGLSFLNALAITVYVEMNIFVYGWKWLCLLLKFGQHKQYID
jgi:hypothetical protein